PRRAHFRRRRPQFHGYRPSGIGRDRSDLRGNFLHVYVPGKQLDKVANEFNHFGQPLYACSVASPTSWASASNGMLRYKVYLRSTSAICALRTSLADLASAIVAAVAVAFSAVSLPMAS